MTRKLTMSAALVLVLGFMPGPAHAQQYGPPTSGNTASIQFVPGTLNLVAGLNGLGYGGDGGPANSATTQLNFPSGVAYDTNGNLFIADSSNYIVRRIDHVSGDISTFAGTEGTEGFTANGGTALGAQFGTTSGLIIDSSNNIYLSDSTNGVIWKITSAGGIAIFAGGGSAPTTCTGSTNSIGDGCLATQATLSSPAGLAFDASGNLYIADAHAFIVREVTTATGKISTFAGVVGDSYYSGCPTALYTTTTGPWTPTQAHLCFPYGVGFDSSGNFYVSESQRYLVRVVTKSTGDISTFAGGGSGTCGTATSTFGDGCPATDAILHYPAGLYVDSANRVYFVDEEGDSIRMVDTTGTITTVFGGNGELTKGSIGEPDTVEVLVNNSPVGSANGIDFFTMDIDGNLVATDADSGAATSAGASGGYYFPETEIFTTETSTEANAFSAAFPPNIIVSNPSGVPLTFTGQPVVNGPFGVVTGSGAGTCTFPGTVAPGKSCTVVVSFTPTEGNNTKFDGTISIDSNAAGSPSVINLQGVGDGTATLSATLTAPGNTNLLTFTSPVSVQSAPQTITLTNTGQIAFAIGSYQITNGPTFSITGTTCPVAPATLAVNGTCTFSVVFDPTSATTFSGGTQVCISTNNYGCINGPVVEGTGTGVVTLTPSPVAFNSEQVGNTSSPMTATLTNGNEPALTNVTATIVGTNPTDFAIVTGTNSCTSTVDGDGGTCSIYVTFSPASATSFSATLQVTGMASGSPVTVSVPLTGSGTPSSFGDTLSLSSINFYGQIVGTTSGTITEQVSNPAVGESGNINFSAITATPPFAIGTGANACSTTAPLEPDTVCNIYVTFAPGAMQAYTGNLTLTSNATGSPQMVPLSGQGVIFNSPEYVTQAMQTMNVYFTAYGETVDIYLLTQGSNNQEFTPDATAGSCHKGTSYSIGQSCTVNVDFSPYAPGAVSGAIVITDPNGNILAEQDLPGTGTGPLVAFEPGVQSTVPAPTTDSGYQAPLGVAVDENDDVFIADSVNNRVVEVQNATTPVVLPATSPTLNDPFGVAVDGLGDVFVADTLNGRVVEWPWNAEKQAFGTPTYIEGSFSEPAGVATDGYGNLYVADEGHNEVFAVPVQPGGTYGTPVALPFTGLHFPKGVFVDGNNNVFVADTGDGNIDELPWTGTGYGTQATVVSGLIQPIAIAVDASGSIYTGDGYVGGVYQVPFNGTSYGPMNLLPITGMQSTLAVAVDPYGDVFVCDGLNNDVQELFVQNPPVLNFATTAIGKTSTDSPKTVTLTNIGNQPLALDGADGGNPSYPTDFPENSSASTLCTGGTNVNPGASCVVSANFTPLNPGNLSETVAILDNNYGEAGNEDDISVNGTATGSANTAPTLSSTTLDFGGVQIYTTSFPLEESVTNNTGAPVTLTTISITQTGTTVFFLGTGTNQCTNGKTLTVGQTCNIYVTFTPTVSGQAYTGTLNVGSTSLTVALSGTGVYFNQQVGNTSPSEGVAVLLTQAGNIASTWVLTDGQSGDFQAGTPGSCPSGGETPIPAGTVCNVPVTFAPVYSGLRAGAIILTDVNNNILGETFLQGTGQAPQVIFSPTTAVQFGYITGLVGVAVDGSDNLYYIDGSDNLKELAAGANSATTITSLDSLLNGAQPDSMAIDGAGDLFIGSNTSTPLIEVQSIGAGQWASPTAINTAPSGWAASVATDAVGNVYFLDPAHGVYQLPFTGNGYNSAVLLAFPSGSNYVYDAVAVDSGGNVYALVQNSSTGATQVLELPATNVGFGTESTILTISQISAGTGIWVDNNGDLYLTGLTTSTSGAVYFVPGLSGGGFGTPVSISTGLYYSVTLDGANNVFLTEANFEDGEQIVELPQATAPSLTFANTAVGSTSSDSPKYVTVTNIGNVAMPFYSITYPADFPEGTPNNQCSTENPLNPGSSCTISTDFTPTVPGTLSEDVVLDDENLFNGSSQQKIPVSGNATQTSGPTATLTGVNFGSVGQGQQSANMAAVFTNTSTTTAITITGITKAGPNTADFYFGGGTNPCSVSTPVAAGASCNIWFNFIPTLNGNATESATVTVTDSATNSPQTASLTGTATGTPAATLSTTALNFGGVQINTASVPLIVTVTNSGTGQLNITGESITQTGSAFALIQGSNQCSTNLLPNGVGCNIYITYNPTVAATTSTGTLNIGGVSQTVSLTGTGVSFVEPASQASTPQLVAVNIAAAGTLAAINIESTGSSDYVFGVENSGNTCTYGTAYTVGQLCQVQIFFTPLDPGDNPGAVILSDANGNVLGETYLAGTGQGAQAVFYSPHTAPTTVASSLAGPYGIAVDAAGNVYVAESNGSNVIQIPVVSAEGGIRKPESHRSAAGSISASTTYGTPISLGGGVWDNPSGIAVDGAGDVFVADPGNNQVWEMMWNGSSRTFGAPFVVYNEEGESTILPVSVAVDNYGNLYLGVDISSDGPNGTAEILELPQTNFGAFGNPITIAQNLFTGWDDQRTVPFGLTVDSQGNVYAGVFSTNSVVEFSPTGPGTFTSGTTLNLTGLQSVTALARDANDDLYIADPLNGQVVTYHNQSAETTLFHQESVGLAVDQQGDVFAGLSAIPSPGSNDSVVEYAYSQPVPLTFATTAVGSVSSDSPMTETILNIGNTSLYFNAQDNNPVYPVNFPINSTDNNLCEEDNSVEAGSSCDVSANFAPTVAGSLSGNIVLTDNNLNRTTAQQSIPVSGTATGSAGPTATLTGISFGSVTEGVTSVAMTATLTNTSTTAALTISGITITGTNAGDFVMTTGTGACGASLAANTSCKIYATFTPSLVGAETATLNVADNATGSPQTAALTGTGTAPLVPMASLSPTTLPFGNQAVNTSSAVMTTTLSNTGTGVLNIAGIFLNEPNENEGVVKGPRVSAITISSSPDYSATTTCGATLAAGSTCTISVTFDPQTAGSLPGTLSVSDNASNSPQTASLTGTGITQGNYTVASPTPPQTVLPGKTASYTINVSVTPNGDIYNNPVTLSASGLPAGATATFSPATVTPGTSTATSTMSVQTAPYNALLVPASSSKWPLPSLALMFGGAWALFRRKHRERFARLLTLLLLLGGLGAATMGLMGCGAGFDKNTLPAAKTYTITVTGTSGEQTQTTTVQLTVE